MRGAAGDGSSPERSNVGWEMPRAPRCGSDWEDKERVMRRLYVQWQWGDLYQALLMESALGISQRITKKRQEAICMGDAHF